MGEAARNQAAQNPHNTVFDAKRLIGMRFSGGRPGRVLPRRGAAASFCC